MGEFDGSSEKSFVRPGIVRGMGELVLAVWDSTALDRAELAGGQIAASAPPYQWSVTGLGIAFGLLVKAQAFRPGSTLADDVHGLI